MVGGKGEKKLPAKSNQGQQPKALNITNSIPPIKFTSQSFMIRVQIISPARNSGYLNKNIPAHKLHNFPSQIRPVQTDGLDTDPTLFAAPFHFIPANTHSTRLRSLSVNLVKNMSQSRFRAAIVPGSSRSEERRVGKERR